jgi:hypothetical protein
MPFPSIISSQAAEADGGDEDGDEYEHTGSLHSKKKRGRKTSNKPSALAEPEATTIETTETGAKNETKSETALVMKHMEKVMKNGGSLKEKELIRLVNIFVSRTFDALSDMKFDPETNTYVGFCPELETDLMKMGILKSNLGYDIHSSKHEMPNWGFFRKMQVDICDKWVVKPAVGVFNDNAVTKMATEIGYLSVYGSLKEIYHKKCEWGVYIMTCLDTVFFFQNYLHISTPQATKYNYNFTGVFIESLLKAKRVMLDLFQSAECLKKTDDVFNKMGHNSVACVHQFPAQQINYVPDSQGEHRFIIKLTESLSRLNLLKKVNNRQTTVYQSVEGLPFAVCIGNLKNVLEYMFTTDHELLLAKQACGPKSIVSIAEQISAQPLWKHVDILQEMFIVNGPEGDRAMEWQHDQWVPVERTEETHEDTAPQIILFRYPNVEAHSSSLELKEVYRPLIGPTSFIMHHAGDYIAESGSWGNDSVKSAISYKGNFPKEFTPMHIKKRKKKSKFKIYNTIPLNLFKLEEKTVVDKSANSGRKSRSGHKRRHIDHQQVNQTAHFHADGSRHLGDKKQPIYVPILIPISEWKYDAQTGEVLVIDDDDDDDDGRSFVQVTDWQKYDLRPDDTVLNELCMYNTIQLDVPKVVSAYVPQTKTAMSGDATTSSKDEYSAIKIDVTIPKRLFSCEPFSPAWSNLVSWILGQIPDINPFTKIVNTQMFSPQTSMILFGQTAGRAVYGNWDKLPFAVALTGAAGSGKSSFIIPILEWAEDFAAGLLSSSKGQFNLEEWINEDLSRVIIANDLSKADKDSSLTPDVFKNIMDCSPMETQSKNVQEHSKHEVTQSMIITSNLTITDIFFKGNKDETNAILRRVLEFSFTKTFVKNDRNIENPVQSYQQNMAMFLVVSNIFYNITMLFRCKSEEQIIRESGRSTRHLKTKKNVLEANPFNFTKFSAWVPRNLCSQLKNLDESCALLAILEPCDPNETILIKNIFKSSNARNKGFVAAFKQIDEKKCADHYKDFSALIDLFQNNLDILSSKYGSITNDPDEVNADELLEMWPSIDKISDSENGLGVLFRDEHGVVFNKMLGDTRKGVRIRKEEYRIVGWKMKDVMSTIVVD